MFDSLEASVDKAASESISTGESSYSVIKKRNGTVAVRAIQGGSEEIILPAQIGGKVFELMKMQDIAERHLTDPESQRIFGGTFMRYFGGISDSDAREDPIKAVQHQLANLNCHWLGRTLLPGQYYTVENQPRQRFETFESFKKAITNKKLPWVGQVYSRTKGLGENGNPNPIDPEPIHSFVALADDAGRTVCFEKIGYGHSFRIVPLEHVYRAWEQVLHTAADDKKRPAAAEPYFSFSAEYEA